MATNPPKGDGHRNGAVKERSQVYNPTTDTWTKRNSNNGQFMDGKKATHHLRVYAKKNEFAQEPKRGG